MQRRVTVGDAMNPEFVGVTEADGVVETLALLEREGAECALVLRGDEVLGVVTPWTACRLLIDGEDPSATAVGDAMTEAVPTVTPDADLAEAAEVMTSQACRHLVVTDGGEPAGVVTEHDLVAATTLVAGRPGSPGTSSTSRGDATTDNYAEQSVCEECGSLSGTLREVGGRVVCPDCAGA